MSRRKKRDIKSKLRQRAKKKSTQLVLVHSKPEAPSQSWDDPEIIIRKDDFPPGGQICPGCGSREQSHMRADDFELPITMQVWWFCRGCEKHWGINMCKMYVDASVLEEEREPIFLPEYPFRFKFKKLTAKHRVYLKTIYLVECDDEDKSCNMSTSS